MKRIKAEFPAVVSNRANSDAIAGWLLDNKRYPNYANMRLAVSTLASNGSLLLNPSAVGIPEDRYGDSIEGAYQSGSYEYCFLVSSFTVSIRGAAALIFR